MDGQPQLTPASDFAITNSPLLGASNTSSATTNSSSDQNNNNNNSNHHSKPHHKMSMASKLSIKLGNIFSNEKKSSAAAAAAASSSASAAAANIESLQEKQRREEVLKCTRTSRLGFPYRPSSIAYDSVQRLVAVGTKLGYVKLFGAESIEYTLYHAPSKSASAATNASSSSSLAASAMAAGDNGSAGGGSGVLATGGGSSSSGLATSFAPAAVLFMSFVVNEGALITYCDDCTLSFWNLRQKQPGILFTKKLINEK